MRVFGTKNFIFPHRHVTVKHNRIHTIYIMFCTSFFSQPNNIYARIIENTRFRVAVALQLLKSKMIKYGARVRVWYRIKLYIYTYDLNTLHTDVQNSCGNKSNANRRRRQKVFTFIIMRVIYHRRADECKV